MDNNDFVGRQRKIEKEKQKINLLPVCLLLLISNSFCIEDIASWGVTAGCVVVMNGRAASTLTHPKAA